MATKLTQRKVTSEEVRERLRDFGFTIKCPVSGHSSWTLVNDFVTVVQWEDKVIFNNSYPAVMLACDGCGYMALFSAIKLGLVEPDKEAV